VFGDPCRRSRLPIVCAGHTGTTGVRSGSRACEITRCTTSFNLNHAHRESRCPEQTSSTTGMRTTPCTTGTGMTEPTRRAFQNRDSPHLNREKEGQSPCHGRRTAKVSGERVCNGTTLAPDHADFRPCGAPSAARPLQRVLASVQLKFRL
jgi:hypothetical protein